jgi:AcrR family transcriptional regulator
VVADPTIADNSTSWRELAVARSLDTARARAEKRVQRFLDAALELMATSDNQDFTVQQVVERSGQSLRSFYQYFEGKYELLLALFEESIAQTAVQLADVVAEEPDPLERLQVFVTEYYKRCSPTPKGKNAARAANPNPLAIAEFAQQLMTQHPKEASKAFEPLVDLFVQLLDDAANAGAMRKGFNHRRIAGVVLQAIMFNAFAATISGLPVRDGDQALLDLLLHGIAAG